MHVYCLGIAGAGVSALASFLLSQGHRVSGSDEAAFPPITTYLDRLGIPYRNGFDAAAIPADVDVAIIGASAKLGGAENPELTELKRRGVPTYSFPEFLGRQAASRETVVVAGSFGKSTLTAMIAYFLRVAGRDPGFFIGAAPLDLETSGHAGRDPQLILEGDEYIVSPEDRRSKFLLYAPQHTIITSLVHDHYNVFPTPESYEQPFEDLIALTPPEGLLLCARGQPALNRIAAKRHAVWYGLEPGAGYGADDIRLGEVSTFTLTAPGGARLALETPLLGLHNIENIIGAAAFLMERGLAGPHDIAAAAAKFRGVARRLDKKTIRSRVPVYEGFGSSYEKARSAIEAILAHFPTRPTLVVFEPHAFSWRNAQALPWYDTVFAGAARVLILPPPVHGAAGHAQLSQEEILARAAAAQPGVEGVVSGAETVERLRATLTGEEVVLLLSSGPLDGLAESLPAALDALFAA